MEKNVTGGGEILPSDVSQRKKELTEDQKETKISPERRRG